MSRVGEQNGEVDASKVSLRKSSISDLNLESRVYEELLNED